MTPPSPPPGQVESLVLDYTHIHTDYKSTSVLDHFIMNERLLSMVEDCGSLHLGDNRSRHSPVMVKLNLGAIPLKEKEIFKSKKRPAWYKAKVEEIESYTQELDSRLMEIYIPRSMYFQDLNYILVKEMVWCWT